MMLVCLSRVVVLTQCFISSFVVSVVFSMDFCVCVTVFGSLILISLLKRAVAGATSVNERGVAL